MHFTLDNQNKLGGISACEPEPLGDTFCFLLKLDNPHFMSTVCHCRAVLQLLNW